MILGFSSFTYLHVNSKYYIDGVDHRVALSFWPTFVKMLNLYRIVNVLKTYVLNCIRTMTHGTVRDVPTVHNEVRTSCASNRH